MKNKILLFAFVLVVLNGMYARETNVVKAFNPDDLSNYTIFMQVKSEFEDYIDINSYSKLDLIKFSLMFDESKFLKDLNQIDISRLKNLSPMLQGLKSED